MTSRQQPFVGDGDISAQISSVNLSAGHAFSKAPQPAIRLLEGLGAKGDAHCGATVKHRSRVRKDPTQPNLRQVHLLHSELFDEAARTGHPLRLGDAAEVLLTGLRNPCNQIDGFSHGLLKHMVRTSEDGRVVRRAGVMAVVRRSGLVCAGDLVTVVLLPEPHHELDVV